MCYRPSGERGEVWAQGYGLRYNLMFNDFVIVGPADDPAEIAGATTTGAFMSISERRTVLHQRRHTK